MNASISAINLMRIAMTRVTTPRPVRKCLLGYPILFGIVMVMNALIMQGCAHFTGAPEGLDYSRTRTSEGGLYSGTILPQADPVPQGRLHVWTLHVETADGKPVEAAEIDVDGGMPQHGHGLPTRPRVTRPLGNGDHLVEGMKFNMGGWWVVEFHINTEVGVDTLVFNLAL